MNILNLKELLDAIISPILSKGHLDKGNSIPTRLLTQDECIKTSILPSPFPPGHTMAQPEQSHPTVNCHSRRTRDSVRAQRSNLPPPSIVIASAAKQSTPTAEPDCFGHTTPSQDTAQRSNLPRRKCHSRRTRDGVRAQRSNPPAQSCERSEAIYPTAEPDCFGHRTPSQGHNMVAAKQSTPPHLVQVSLRAQRSNLPPPQSQIASGTKRPRKDTYMQ